MSIWNFDMKDLKPEESPLTIVSNYCKELFKISGEKIIARVTEYDGKYRSSNSVSYVQAMSAVLNGTPAFNVQSIMGENAGDDESGNGFVYELFLTSKNTPKYKYRVLIMYFGISRYPVGLTIQQEIAKEIGINSEGTKYVDESSFKTVLEKILGSNTLGGVLRNLAILNL